MDTIKNLFLAAVGGTRLSYEKAEETLKTLIEKGQISVTEGKVLSEDIKRVVQGDNGVRTEDPLDKTLSERILNLQTQVEALTEEVSKLKGTNTVAADSIEVDDTTTEI
ncbi:hypothetical protein [Aerococcus sp. 1KP-2016]|jgi:polyhydroxyalkanoate synthesis regulator phasin|uniref:hypothetical protein n=1 Tax=Aerococcus sp. 1KP-2016 TaxID=1981982 RepID=UPI000B99B7A2|nr:hypothetical protein [Aerococcus sp. 1KP-2016]OYQ67896.1 hypothetical protein B9P78_01980 [Aerococcus sp. 1KP-2016]